jgi:1-acyl-sn-glycerol-3-phosphate acyltransferase
MSTEELARFVRQPVRAVSFGGVTTAMLAAFKVHERLVPTERREALLDRYRRVWLDAALGMFGIETEVHPAPPLPATGARLVVSNHRSALDIPVLLRLFDGYVLSRADLAGWPLLGTVARTAGTIFVEREQGASRAAAARAIRRKLAEGATVIVYPEGTTHVGDEVHRFHSGAFAAAKGLGVQVVPVGLAYAPGTEFGEETFLAHLGRTAGRRRTRVVACIGEPLTIGDDARALADECRARVQSLVHEARKHF